MSELTSVPDVEGLSWRLYPTAEYLGLTNSSDQTVTIFGYEGEPYLRIGPEGVEENLASPTRYLNQRRNGDVALPPRADAAAEPDWERVSGDPRFVWFDHRVHRMPDDVRPDGAVWTVPFAVGETRYELTGALRYAPGPPWWLWFGIGLVVTSPVLLGLRRRDLQARLAPGAAVLVAVAAYNLIHVPDEFLALPLSAVDIAYGVLHNLLFIGAGIVGAVVAQRQGSLAILLAGSAAVAFHQGALQTVQLGAADLPTVWPEAMIRLAVGSGLAQALWIVLLVWLTARQRSRPVDPDASAGPGPGKEVPSKLGRSAPVQETVTS